MVMKKCFKFLTWEEQEDMILSVNESYIIFVTEEKYDITYVGNGLEAFSTRTNIVKHKQLIPYDPILQKLCELTGAKIYGDHSNYYIVLNEIKNDYLNNDIVIVGDVISSFDYYGENMSFYYTLVPDVHNYPFNNYVTKNNYVSSNIFEEYSKFLRKEENKWEDARKVLNIEL